MKLPAATVVLCTVVKAGVAPVTWALVLLSPATSWAKLPYSAETAATWGARLGSRKASASARVSVALPPTAPRTPPLLEAPERTVINTLLFQYMPWPPPTTGDGTGATVMIAPGCSGVV